MLGVEVVGWCAYIWPVAIVGCTSSIILEKGFILSYTPQASVRPGGVLIIETGLED